jgi:predicted N-acetyltransferase YhbS
MTTIRPARPEEAAVLTALCMRSKAHWGYDAEFMRQAEAALTISPSRIATGGFLVAETAAGTVLGVAAIENLDVPGRFELAYLFVEPTAIRTGIGRALFIEAARLAALHDGEFMSILADPFAEPFYRRLGAVRVGDAASDAIPGRVLPLLEFRLSHARRD